ncbi:MAG: NAD(P)-dependent oxidoreductase [Armatimonadetes bacterium]|nr:NAD(P)-dependent oxidoreductase [Armatimonadota bacterium]
MKLVVTGAAGRIGSTFIRLCGTNYDLTLTDRWRPWQELSDSNWLIGDICDEKFLAELFCDADAVLHLAGNPGCRSPLEDLWKPNVLGAMAVFKTAFECGVRRVVFASSIHSVLGYPPGDPVPPEWPAHPRNLYGATKVFAEQLCRAYAEAGMSCLAVRIGAFSPVPTNGARWQGEGARQFISEEDLCQLLHRALNAPESLRFGIFHGVSDNAEKRLDITSTVETLGYSPVHGAGPP